jgi:hypothetical protein
MTKVKVVLALTWVDGDVAYLGGDVVEVKPSVARRLIYNGQARAAVSNEEEVQPQAKATTRRAKKVSAK